MASRVSNLLLLKIMGSSLLSLLGTGGSLWGGLGSSWSWGWGSFLGWGSGLGWGGTLLWGSGGLGWSGLSWGSLSWGGLGWGSLSWGSSGLGDSLIGGLLLLEVLGEELLISDMSLLRLEPSVLLGSLHDGLSSDSLLSDESLDLWGLVEDLIVLTLNLDGDGSSDNVLGDIILSLSEDESFSDVLSSLWSESSWSVGIGKSSNFTFTLDKDFEGNDGKIWSTDASSGGLSLSFSGSSWSVESGSYSD
jgi:hypothetical protein